METIIKRKNIDLPIDVLQKLSLMAVAQGRSLKAYIEQILINKANSISIEVHENPSPSGDEWFENADNMESVNRGIKEMNEGQGRAYTMDEIRKSLGAIFKNGANQARRKYCLRLPHCSKNFVSIQPQAQERLNN